MIALTELVQAACGHDVERISGLPGPMSDGLTTTTACAARTAWMEEMGD